MVNCRWRGKRRSRATQRETLIMDGMEDGVTDSRDDLSQCGCDMSVRRTRHLNSVQACSDLAHVVLVLVGVRRVTVVIVHIGHQDVVVVIYLCVANLFVNCCIRRCSLYRNLHLDCLRCRNVNDLLLNLLLDSLNNLYLWNFLYCHLFLHRMEPHTVLCPLSNNKMFLSGVHLRDLHNMYNKDRRFQESIYRYGCHVLDHRTGCHKIVCRCRSHVLNHWCRRLRANVDAGRLWSGMVPHLGHAHAD